MRIFVALDGRLLRRSAILMGLVFVMAVTAAQARDPMPMPPADAALAVHLDQARIIKLPERTATLVVGNPLIADATVQPGGIAVITGKSYGGTNLVALDRSGAMLMEHPVLVLGPRDIIVVVHRGVERESYSCTPKCERRITLGDTANYFNMNLMQTGNLNTQAQGGQQK
jgi:hypothetical protein